jgi:hypothetical protein
MTPWLWLRASSVFQTSNLGEWLEDEAVASRAHARAPGQMRSEAVSSVSAAPLSERPGLRGSG